MSVVLWNRRVLPWFQYGDNLGLSPYGWDLILHEAYVEHCEQPLVSFSCSTRMLSLPAALLLFKAATPLLYSGKPLRYLLLLGVVQVF